MQSSTKDHSVIVWVRGVQRSTISVDQNIMQKYFTVVFYPIGNLLILTPCNENRVFPVQFFFTGKNLFSLQVFPCKEKLHRENPVFITGRVCSVMQNIASKSDLAIGGVLVPCLGACLMLKNWKKYSNLDFRDLVPSTYVLNLPVIVGKFKRVVGQNREHIVQYPVLK